MRIVVVNHHHPQARAIGAVRMARFAEALTDRGHRVVLLTGPLDDADPPLAPDAVADALAAHDWTRPFHLACPLHPLPLLAAAREGRLPRPPRWAVLGWHYLRHGGVFTDWTRGCRPYWPVLAEVFRPEVTWGTFGNTDAWAIARGIARLSDCPWAMDIKDSWNGFIPRPFRHLLAWRYDDAATCTGLSQGYLDRSGRWFRAPKTVVYSGIPAGLLDAPRPVAPPFRITVTGSTYGHLDVMIDGIRRFLDHVPESQIVFTYAGREHEAAARRTQGLAGHCTLDIRPYVALDELAALQREAFVNVYGRAMDQPDIFHHKLFELLCADRPIACVPTEMPEAVTIAADLNADFTRCENADALATRLERAWRERHHPGTVDHRALAFHTWAAQAERLETALAAAVAGGGR